MSYVRELFVKEIKGGEGSGHFGHEGRPGEVGGSGPGGGGGEKIGKGKTGKSAKLPMFAVRNDTNKWIVMVDGFHQQFDTEKEAQQVYDKIGGEPGSDGLAGTAFGSADMLPPHYEPKYRTSDGKPPSGSVASVSTAHQINMEDYIDKHSSRLLQRSRETEVTTAKERLEGRRFWAAWKRD